MTRWTILSALLLTAAPTAEILREQMEPDPCTWTAVEARAAVEKTWQLHRESPLGFWYQSPSRAWRALIVQIKGEFLGVQFEDFGGWVACYLETERQ